MKEVYYEIVPSEVKRTMSWPNPSEYQDAIQNPQTVFLDSQLRAGKPAVNALGLPKVASGNFASVYEIRSGAHCWAVRCFLRSVSDQQTRYACLSEHLADLALPCLVDFEFQPQGILVRGKRYPIVKMEWVEGIALHTYVRDHLTDSATLRRLAAQWRGLANSLRGNRLAHGDLQHGNVLVTPQGDLRLVDYDAMFVPSLQGKRSHEIGHSNYQHPARTAEDFDDRLDNFSALSIYLSLRALSADPILWRFSSGENLIFSAPDYRAPLHSPVFQALRSNPDRDVRALSAHLEACSSAPLGQMLDFESLVGAKSRNPSAVPPAPLRTSPAKAGSRLPGWMEDETSTNSTNSSLWYESGSTSQSTTSVSSPVLSRPGTVAPAVPVNMPVNVARVAHGSTPARFKKNVKDGAEMVMIPAGESTMGNNASSDEKPVHQVKLDGYYIYRTPVTVAQYLKFCDQTGHAKPTAPGFNPNWSKWDHPIVNVNYNDALAYCRWAGVKLPTEAQWEKAASWNDVKKVQREFPWGDDFDSSKLQCSKSAKGDAGGTRPVGSFPSGASPYDVLHMAGNVWQWCSDWYAEEFYSSPLATERNPENQSVGQKKYRALRGGSWYGYDPHYFRSAYRLFIEPDGRDDNFGFRCVSGL